MKRYCCAVLLVIFIILNGYASENLTATRATLQLKRASLYLRSIATNGGYAGIYSLDLKERYGEAQYEKASDSEIWVQPPGTPSVGGVFLRAWLLTGDVWYKQAAIDAAKALVWGQRNEGGWDHRVDVSHYNADAVLPVRKSGNCTFDDEITQGALSFLMELDRHIDEQWLTESISLGLAFMRKSQFENGAWPQWYPLRGGYHDYYTFNDNAINDNIALMLKAHALYGKEEFLNVAMHGGDFIILSQMPVPQAGWAQQYSHDLKPAWARSFEPPCVCSAVTARNIRTLVDLYRYTGDKHFLDPVPAALQWLERSRIDEGVWARMYEVGTNRPIYGDRDKKVHYTLEEISEERRKGYSWQSGFGIKNAEQYYRKAVNETKEFKSNAVESETNVSNDTVSKAAGEACESLDESGRWIDEGTNHIYTRDYVKKAGDILDYLEYTR